METLQEKEIRQLFDLSVLLKGAISLFEVVGGILALLIPPAAVTNFIIVVSQGELAEDPGDFIATHLSQLAGQLSVASGTFIAFYLLSRGLIKLGLVVALLKNKLWAYPASLAVLGLFIIYQLYQIILSHSLLITAITAFDLIVVYFIWKEYTIVSR